MEEPEKQRMLGESFRQSRKEFWFMIGTWIAFAIWTCVCNGLLAKEADAEIELLFGMPKWVFLGVAAPWTVALGVTVWFALCYMEDTSLGPEEEENKEPGGGE